MSRTFVVVLTLLVVISETGIRLRADDAATSSKTATLKSPLSPEESLKHFVLADPNLQIEIVAAEPEVIDPVAIQFDEHGRLWVVELSDYPNGPEPGKPPMSRIKLLEDKDGDGRYETAHIFADKLLFATGVQPWDGGVIVTLAGEVAYFKDTDGDHKADFRETWFTGFAQANPQLRANHPTFGPDGWIYVANGLRGGDVIAVKKDWPSRLGLRPDPSGKAKVGTESQPTDPQPVSLTGRDFKFDPLTGRYEAISGNGQFGMTFDAWGNRFVCDNRHPCRHVIFEEDFIKRCPHVAFPAVVHDVIPADDKNRVFPLTSAWTTSNLHAGTFTASCGVTVYTGDWLPEEFRGNVFVCEPTGNLVQRAILEPDGVTFKSRNPYVSGTALAAGRTGPDIPTRNTAPTAASAVPLTNGTQEFLASRDDWFRPVDLQNGPDGALYVVDMYRAVIEHPEWVPDELKKRPDTWLGNDMGRIYRIRSVTTKRRPLELDELRKKPFVFLNDDGVDADRDGKADQELAGWYRTTASRLVHEKLIHPNGMASLQSLLQECTGRSREDQRVLWRPELSSSMWQSPHLSERLGPYAPLRAIEPQEEYFQLERLILKRVTATVLDEGRDQAARDRAATVAMQLMFGGLKKHETPENNAYHVQAVQTWNAVTPPSGLRTALLASIATSRETLSDPWLRLAMLASEGERAAAFLAELIDVGADQFNCCASSMGGCRGEEGIEVWGSWADFFFAIGEQAGRTATRDELANAVILLSHSVAPKPDLWGSSVNSLEIAGSGLLGIAKGLSRRGGELNGDLSKISPQSSVALSEISERAIRRSKFVDPKEPLRSRPSRQIAVRLLQHLKDEKAFDQLKHLAENEADQTLRFTAVESFVALRRPEVDAWLIERYRSETPAIRRAILAALFASKERQLRLLEAIEQGQIAATELDPVRVNQLTQAKDETLRERAKKILAAAAPASRKEVLDAYQPALSLKADPKRGRELFVKNCSTCHRVDNVGVNVAPDISDTRTKKPEQLLMDIVDPNKAIDANYFAYAVGLKDGTVQSGVISAETATSITLKQPEGKVLTLLRSDIEELRNTGLSLMPVGLEKNVDQQAMADLIFWLKNWRYLDGKVPATSLK